MANDPCGVGPQIALVSFALSLASDAVRLAREACMQAIHSAGVVGWIEQPNVAFVHAQLGEPSVGGALSQDSAAVWIKFNCSDWGVAEDKIGEQSAACAGKEVEGLHVTATPRAWR
jgi:hypothetical protein